MNFRTESFVMKGEEEFFRRWRQGCNDLMNEGNIRGENMSTKEMPGDEETSSYPNATQLSAAIKLLKKTVRRHVPAQGTLMSEPSQQYMHSFLWCYRNIRRLRVTSLITNSLIY